MDPREKKLLQVLFPASPLERNEVLSERIKKAIQHIPQPYQQIIRSYYLEELDFPTIAAKTSLAITTIKSYKQKATELLRRKVNPDYYEEAKRIRKSLYPDQRNSSPL